MALTIVSISRITKMGCAVSFEGDACKIKSKASKIIGVVPTSANGLYRVDHSVVAGAAIETISLLTLHRQLGHISPAAIRTLIKQGTVTGLTLTDDVTTLVCDLCEYAKTTCKAICKEREALQADAFGAEVHSNIWGPSPVQTIGGRKYYITFTDDHMHYTRLQLLRTKDEAFNAYKAFATWAQTQHGVHIKQLQSDRGGEYTGDAFTRFLKEQGTKCQLTTHNTPQHNGVAESLNRCLLERVHAILHHSSLPKTLWGEGVLFMVWLKNRTSTHILSNITPYEHLYQDKPNLGGVPEWGQRVWVHSTTGSKLDAHALEAQWVGFDSDSTHTHHVYWPGKNSVSVERNVKFAPTMDLVRFTLPLLPEGEWSTNQPSASQQEELPSAASDLTHVSTSAQAPVLTPSKIPVPIQPHPTTQSMTCAAGSSMDTSTSSNTRTVAPSSPEGTMPEGEPQGESTSYITFDSNSADFIFHTNFNHDIAAALEEVQDDPKTLHEAQSWLDWQCWKEAMEKEMDMLQKAGTWATVPRPRNKNIVGSKWVFHVKRKANGSIDKYKAQLVAKGFTQVYGVNYFNTYSPITKLSSIRLILALATRHDWEVESFDFNGTYLNRELSDEEEIFMQEPPGYETKEGGPSVKRLLKSLYGLKQAGRKWYEVLCRTLTDLAFCVSDADPGIFHAHIGEHALILAVHVDNCIMTRGSIKLIRDYKRKLNKQHALTDLV